MILAIFIEFLRLSCFNLILDQKIRNFVPLLVLDRLIDVYVCDLQYLVQLPQCYTANSNKYATSYSHINFLCTYTLCMQLAEIHCAFLAYIIIIIA